MVINGIFMMGLEPYLMDEQWGLIGVYFVSLGK